LLVSGVDWGPVDRVCSSPGKSEQFSFGEAVKMRRPIKCQQNSGCGRFETEAAAPRGGERCVAVNTCVAPCAPTARAACHDAAELRLLKR